MKGQAYINEKDIFVNYGATLIRGAYEALLTPAAAKSYISNESRMQHGVRMIANAENARTQSREFVINILIEGSDEVSYLRQYEAFINDVSAGLFELKVPRLGRIFKVVYSSCSKYGNYGLKKGIFALRLVEPNPKDRPNIS